MRVPIILQGGTVQSIKLHANYKFMMKNPNHYFKLNTEQINRYHNMMKQRVIPILQKRKENK